MKKEAIKKEWHVPEKYHAQVREKPETFYNVPHEYRSPQLCLEAVRGWGYNLGIVPEEMKTREMCREAFNASPDLDYGHCAIIGFMPFADVVLECLKDSAGGTDMTDLAATVRPEVMDRKIAGFLVGKDGHCLQYVPVHLQTEELALMAVRTSGNAALLHRSVREDIKTEKGLYGRYGRGLFPVVPAYPAGQTYAGNMPRGGKAVSGRGTCKTGLHTGGGQERMQHIYAGESAGKGLR